MKTSTSHVPAATRKKPRVGIIIAVAVLVVLVWLPFAFAKGAEFGGADAKAMDLISEIAPAFEATAEPLIELPSSEIESLLFCVQAALGGGFIGFFIAYVIYRPKRGAKDEGVSKAA